MVPSHPLKDDEVPVIVQIIAYLSYMPVLNYMTTMPTAYMMDCLCCATWAIFIYQYLNATLIRIWYDASSCVVNFNIWVQHT
jgi:hypothetical protein